MEADAAREDITREVIERMLRRRQDIDELRRRAEDQGNFYVPAELPVFIAVRIKGINKVSPAVKKTLELLRLNKVNTATFVKNNKSTKKMLSIVRGHVAYGYPSLELVRELLYKRGFCRVDGARVNLSQSALNFKFGGEITTVEEIVEIIYECAERFSEVNRFLWPFHLHSPTGGFAKKKILDVSEGGSSGNHDALISDLVMRMI